MTSPLLSRAGAVAAEGVDAGVAWHHGDPVREQRLLEEGLAVVDLSNRSVVTVTGPDRLSWLHSITTQHLTGLPPRTSTETLVLSPKGHVEHALHVVDDGETTWLTAEPGTGAALTTWLRSMQFMLRVETTDRTDDFAVVGEPVDREGAEGEPPTWRDPWPAVAEGSASYAAVPDDEHPGADRAWREVIVPRAEPGGVRRRPPAGRHLGRRGAARRGVATAARPRHRPPDDPARGRLAAHRRPPVEGLLPRPGDGGPGAQPRAAAAPPGDAAPRRLRAPAARGGHRARARRPHRRPDHHGGPPPRAWARWRSRS
nr:hypothetical protein [Angustibacter aerolatus]